MVRASERIIRDVLIIGCNSDKAKDKIVRQGEKIKLQEVIQILQLEDSTRQTLSEMTSTTQKIHLCILWEEEIQRWYRKETEIPESNSNNV